jgi:Tfp pilus assembly protein PilP
LFATAYEAVLERYDPGDLILSGIRQRKISPSGIIVSQACFKTPVGFYVYDSVGGSIGKDFGRIEEIGENYVILNEVFEDKIDEWVERRTKIILSKESECDWKNSIPNIGIPPED